MTNRLTEQKNVHGLVLVRGSTESQIAIHDPRVLQRQGAEQVHQPDEAVQYGVAGQGAILTGLAAIRRDSFVHGLKLLAA